MKRKWLNFVLSATSFALIAAFSAHASDEAPLVRGYAVPAPFKSAKIHPDSNGGSCIGPWLADAPVYAASEYENTSRAGQLVLETARLVRDSHDPSRIAQYMATQNPQDRDSFERMLVAYSGLKPDDIGSFYPANAALMHDFSFAVQAHQDWYESLTTRLSVKDDRKVTLLRSSPEVVFSKNQLSSMRTAFVAAEGMFTNGELLLAFPDRLERNQQVTRQYLDLSDGMTGIVGADNTSWSTVAVWASDLVGRNVFGNALILLAEDADSNPRYWLSVGNSMLISDIGPGFQYFVAIFGNGQNRSLSFEQFWNNFLVAYSNRNISYVDGSGDPDLHMENAFKAYYQAMQIHDQEATVSDPEQLASMRETRAQLMLFGSVLVAMQEQKIVQTVLANGMCMLGIVNPDGAAAIGINYILANAAGNGALVIPTRKNLADTSDRISLDQSFSLVDGQSVAMSQYLCSTLNSLDGPPSARDECNPADSGTEHWEDYGQRMGFIYELFSDYQQYAPIYDDPRAVFGTRATTLNNRPILRIRQLQPRPIGGFRNNPA